MERQKWLSIDGKLWRVLTKVGEALILNFFWLILSVPVLTSGAATIAFYYAMTKAVALGTGRICRLFPGVVSLESQSLHIANGNCDCCGRALLARYSENMVLRKHIRANALLCHCRAAYRDLFLDLPAAFEVRTAGRRSVEDGVLLRYSPFPQNSSAASRCFCRRQPDLDFPAGSHFCSLYAYGACVQNSGTCAGRHCKKQRENQSDSEADPWYLSE